MSTLTGIDICSAALIKLGSNAIESFNDSVNSRGSEIAASLYQDTQLGNQLLASYPWSFAGYQVQLNQLLSKPTDPRFSYAYQLPSDYLSVRNAYDQAGLNIPYFIEDDQLWAMAPEVWLDYTRILAESQWPFYFVELAIAKATWEFAVPLAVTASDVDRAIKEYEYKEKKARNIDANQNQPQVLIGPANSRLVRSRIAFWG